MAGNIVKMTQIRSQKILRNLFHLFGVEISRLSVSPSNTLLGLKYRPIRTVIDIGANTGQYAKYVSGIFPYSKIYSFEPLPDPYQKLQAWASTKNDRVIAINKALGSNIGKAVMNLHVNHTPSSSMLASTEINAEMYPQTRSQKEVVVYQDTLDAAMQELQLEDEILIKMDVQGYEDRVISGGERTFTMAYACISEVVLDHLYENQAHFENIVTLLARFGFHYAGNIRQRYARDGHCIYLDALFLKKKSTI